MGTCCRRALARQCSSACSRAVSTNLTAYPGCLGRAPHSVQRTKNQEQFLGPPQRKHWNQAPPTGQHGILHHLCESALTTFPRHMRLCRTRTRTAAPTISTRRPDTHTSPRCMAAYHHAVRSLNDKDVRLARRRRLGSHEVSVLFTGVITRVQHTHARNLHQNHRRAQDVSRVQELKLNPFHHQRLQ